MYTFSDSVNIAIKLSIYYGQGNTRLELFKIAFKIPDSILGVISKIRVKLPVFSSRSNA